MQIFLQNGGTSGAATSSIYHDALDTIQHKLESDSLTAYDLPSLHALYDAGLASDAITSASMPTDVS